jgi:hypothetical protein
LFGVEDAGRWSLVRRTATESDGDAIEHVARTLLRAAVRAPSLAPEMGPVTNKEWVQTR